MEEISLNSQILQLILECFDESQKVSADQRNVIGKLQYIVQNESFFFCYFIQILVSNLQQESGNILYAQLSIFFIRRYFKYIDDTHIEYFLECIIPVLQNIISDNIHPLISHAAILMSNIVQNYGEQAIPDFDNILQTLISDENTITAGLDVMLELSEKTGNYQIKIEHLQNLIMVFCEIPDSSLTSTFLLVIVNLIQSSMQELYIEFISTEILTFINNNYSKFQTVALLNSMKIIVFFFEKTNDSDLGDFIVYCIHNLEDLLFEGLEYFHESYEYCLDDIKIPFHPGLVESLFEILQSMDEEDEKYDCSDISQEILQDMSEQHGDRVVEIVKELISKSENLPQIFRALCSIAGEMGDEENFFQLAMEHLSDESRGNAALFLSKIVTPETIDQIVSELIPLVLDPDKIVLDKVHHSLENILDPDFEIKPELTWIPPLIEAFTISVNDDDPNCASHISKEICYILNYFEKLNDELFQSFFSNVYDLFFCEEKRSFMFSATILLDVLLKKLDVEYSQKIEAISGQITESLQNAVIALECREHFCSLMIDLIDLYPDQITSHFVQPLFVMTQYFNDNIQNDYLILNVFWQFFVKVFSELPNLIEEAELMNPCIELALHEFNQNQQISTLDLISVFIGFVLKSLDEETVENLLNTTMLVIQINSENLQDLKNIVCLLKIILDYKEEKNSLLAEQAQFYNDVQSKILMNCN